MRSSVARVLSLKEEEGVYMNNNKVLLSALAAFVLAQFIKVFTTWYKEQRWDLKRLIGSGGMPSSHSATVTALAAAVALQDGLGASTFATALILASIVMYDASGVRLQAGRQAQVLNQIVYELPAEHPLAESSYCWWVIGSYDFNYHPLNLSFW
ncbi:hypothetical protein M8C21_004208 [Ambrosia artemisiifolia]|uniref:Acid phosphatase/vanadium-dependent haloperoxidase-related protein n=1 Tax=Ambrosia artemisiifolia TaxID=4212 RepID=A0AAD5D0V1_AMBAR|nr:hypothetical protein M8C21_004208 [Ambrosia artemisiifolia]